MVFDPRLVSFSPVWNNVKYRRWNNLYRSRNNVKYRRWNQCKVQRRNNMQYMTMCSTEVENEQYRR
jgi:hypothetical protein